MPELDQALVGQEGCRPADPTSRMIATAAVDTRAVKAGPTMRQPRVRHLPAWTSDACPSATTAEPATSRETAAKPRGHRGATTAHRSVHHRPSLLHLSDRRSQNGAGRATGGDRARRGAVVVAVRGLRSITGVYAERRTGGRWAHLGQAHGTRALGAGSAGMRMCRSRETSDGGAGGSRGGNVCVIIVSDFGTRMCISEGVGGGSDGVAGLDCESASKLNP